MLVAGISATVTGPVLSGAMRPEDFEFHVDFSIVSTEPMTPRQKIKGCTVDLFRYQ
jgi:hypothetical protein